jgi:hypothetical protein
MANLSTYRFLEFQRKFGVLEDTELEDGESEDELPETDVESDELGIDEDERDDEEYDSDGVDQSACSQPWRPYVPFIPQQPHPGIAIHKKEPLYLTRLVMAENARGGARSNLLLLLRLLHHFQNSVTTSKMNFLELIVVIEPREGNQQRLEGPFHNLYFELAIPQDTDVAGIKRITRARPLCDALINLKQILYAGGWSGEARQDQASIITSCNTDIASRVCTRIKNRVGFLQVIRLG